MKPITRDMIEKYKINKLGYDFMGYTFTNLNQLSFHHLIVPHRECKIKHIPNEGYIESNGAIVRQTTSHDYIHAIERVDRDVFLRITEHMIEENKNGKIDIYTLRKIRDLLLYFEKEHCSDRTKNGQYIIKKSYLRERIKL